MFPSWLGVRGRLVVLALLGGLLLVLLAPGCGRSSLEPETLGDGGNGSGACSPATCPSGCCDASGTCRTGRDVRACGSAGDRCADCVADGFALCNGDGVCGRDDARCSAATCAGCCTVDEGRLRCLSGTEPAACGGRGGACTDCAASGRACDASTRSCGATACDASTCDGCCVGDKCLPGDLQTACGTKGRACAPCASGQVCRAVSGGAGGQCDGPTSCGPHNCAGCCDAAGRCVTGNDATACGAGGGACATCPVGEICGCVPPNARTCQAPPPCGPANCAGCCVGNQCVIDTKPTACGARGEACKTCGTTETCSPTGVCVDAGECNPTTCPTGCCVGSICAVGTQNTACGTDGDVCQNCASQSRVCQSGTCQTPTCGPTTCPNGCCSGNVCVVGTQDNACGPTGGGQCDDCSAKNEVCQGRQCREKCGPANCSGCCRNNTCVGGTADNACGIDGATCTNCSAAGSYCNGLVSPRRCNNQQTTCPAPYGSCPLGTRMPPIATEQRRCTNVELDRLAAECVAGPESAACVAAYATLVGTCQACLQPFHHPFVRNTGIYACAAASVSEPCRIALGCADHCAQSSCNQCSASSKDLCYVRVNGLGGQCALQDLAANCARDEMERGLCSSFSYAHYGQWIRGVGDHFCGDGP